MYFWTVMYDQTRESLEIDNVSNEKYLEFVLVKTVSLSRIFVSFSLVSFNAFLYFFVFYFETNDLRKYRFLGSFFCAITVIFIRMIIFKYTLGKSYKQLKEYSILYRCHYMELFAILTGVFGMCWYNVNRILNGQCEIVSFNTRWGCNPYHDIGLLPMDTIELMLLLPIIYTLICRPTRLVSFCLITMVASSFVVCVYLTQAYDSLGIIIIYLILVSIFLEDLHRQNLLSYKDYEKLKSALALNEELADETAAIELRQMIGNVAHDLKTPLTEMQIGVEYLISELQSMKCQGGMVNTKSNQITEAKIFDELSDRRIESMQITAQSIQSSMVFMAMSVNRCLDYTKASKGIPLIPRIENVNLFDLVSTNVNTINGMQSKVIIQSLIELRQSDIIHNHIDTKAIRTDKLWLEESILSLLSNAVKYNNGNSVVLRVSIEENKPVPEATRKFPFPVLKYFVHSNSMHPLDNIAARRTSKSKLNTNKSTPLAMEDFFDKQHPSTTSLTTTVSKEPSDSRLVPQKNTSLKSFGFRFYKPSHNSVYIDDNQYKTVPTDGQIVEFSYPSNSVSHYNETPDEETSMEYEYPSIRMKEEESSTVPLKFLLFEIEDDGNGIDEELLNKLFKPFKQAKRLTGGTGLGLYTLAKRIEALQGSYGVKSRSDGLSGSIFWFRIPYHPVENDTSLGIYNTDSSIDTNINDMKTINQMMLQLSNEEFDFDARLTSSGKIAMENLNHSKGNELQQNKQNNHKNNIIVEPSVLLMQQSNSEPIILKSIISEETINRTNFVFKSNEKIFSPSNLSVLVVDDSITILKITSMMLKKEGFITEVAENGAVAVEKILHATPIPNQNSKSFGYDIILMDIQMPVMGGLEATNRTRSAFGVINETVRQCHSHDTDPIGEVKLKRPLIIGFSANSDEDTKRQALKHGMDAFISKPFTCKPFIKSWNLVWNIIHQDE